MFADSDDIMDKYYIDAETGKKTVKRGGETIDLGTEGKSLFHLKRSYLSKITPIIVQLSRKLD
jgi:hypothetical protein